MVITDEEPTSTPTNVMSAPLRIKHMGIKIQSLFLALLETEDEITRKHCHTLGWLTWKRPLPHTLWHNYPFILFHPESWEPDSHFLHNIHILACLAFKNEQTLVKVGYILYLRLEKNIKENLLDHLCQMTYVKEMLTRHTWSIYIKRFINSQIKDEILWTKERLWTTKHRLELTWLQIPSDCPRLQLNLQISQMKIIHNPFLAMLPKYT